VLGNVIDQVVGGDRVVHAPIGCRDALQVVNGGFTDVQRAFWPATAEAWWGDNQATSAAQLAGPARFPQPQLLGRALVEQAQQLPVELAWPFLAALPLANHVGVDADMDAVVSPGQPAQLRGDFLQGQAQQGAVLTEVGDIGPDRRRGRSPRSAVFALMVTRCCDPVAWDRHTDW
jgi:hypothetical protein